MVWSRPHMTTALGTERIRAARLIGSLDTKVLIAGWTAALAESGVLRDTPPSDKTVARIVTALQRGLAMHLEAPRARLDVDTGALADDAAMAHVFQRGVTITQITEGVFCFMDVIFKHLEKADLYVPTVAEMVRDFAKRFLRMTGESWSAILVAQRSEAERARAELQRILESTNEGVLLVGKDLSLRFANARASELLGAPLHAHLGENLHHLLTEVVAPGVAEPEGFLARLRHLYGTMEEIATDEMTMVDPPRDLSRYSAPVRDAAGRTIGRVEIYRDVTVERRARRARDSFLGLVGHELRTPLAAISGYIDLAARSLPKLDLPQTPQRERLASYLQRGRANVDRIVRLVDTLLTVERFESGRWPVDLRPVDFASIVSESVANYAGASARPVSLRVPSGQVPIAGDPDRLDQVVTNLLSNAVRHASQGFAPDVSLEVQGPEAVLTVSDDGAGVPQAERERIFDRFYRMPEGGFRSGIGLGLFVVRQLVDAHAGTVTVGEREGGGAAFTVRLPLAAEGG